MHQHAVELLWCNLATQFVTYVFLPFFFAFVSIFEPSTWNALTQSLWRRGSGLAPCRVRGGLSGWAERTEFEAQNNYFTLHGFTIFQRASLPKGRLKVHSVCLGCRWISERSGSDISRGRRMIIVHPQAPPFGALRLLWAGKQLEPFTCQLPEVQSCESLGNYWSSNLLWAYL